MKSKSKILSTRNTIAKTTAKATDGSQKKLNDTLAEYNKRLRMLQSQFDAQKKTIEEIRSQNKQLSKAINKIASTIPNVNAFNQGLKTMQKMNPSNEITRVISKINSNLISQVNESLNNVDFSSHIEKVFKRYEPSEPFIKAVEDMNPSDQIDNMIEQFRQDWKYELDRAISTFREVNEKRTEQRNILEGEIKEEEDEKEQIKQINDKKELRDSDEDNYENEDKNVEENEQTYEKLQESKLQLY